MQPPLKNERGLDNTPRTGGEGQSSASTPMTAPAEASAHAQTAATAGAIMAETVVAKAAAAKAKTAALSAPGAGKASSFGTGSRAALRRSGSRAVGPRG